MKSKRRKEQNHSPYTHPKSSPGTMQGCEIRTRQNAVLGSDLTSRRSDPVVCRHGGRTKSLRKDQNLCRPEAIKQVRAKRDLPLTQG